VVHFFFFLCVCVLLQFRERRKIAEMDERLARELMDDDEVSRKRIAMEEADALFARQLFEEEQSAAKNKKTVKRTTPPRALAQDNSSSRADKVRHLVEIVGMDHEMANRLLRQHRWDLEKAAAAAFDIESGMS
jgi:low affinity Fe/Cu permease